MRKGVLEYCVLGIIAQGEIYASDVIERLKSSDLIVVEGTLYPLLTRLKNAGLLSYNWVESQQGPPRKYYQLTTEGRSAFENLTAAWNQLIESVEKATSTKSTNQK